MNEAYHNWKRGQYCNAGGPMSRSRQERLSASVLGKDKGRAVHCPRVMPLALDFEEADPVETIYALLAARGLDSPEALRAVIHPRSTAAICRPSRSLRRIKVATAKPGLVLRKALMLGLCTPWLYDPSRPVIWTSTSLQRSLQLFDGEGFYAC